MKTPADTIAAALAILNAGDVDGARRILAASMSIEDDEGVDNDDEIEDCDDQEDFPPDGRFDGIPRNWMGEPC
jgi:hypothetical protein